MHNIKDTLPTAPFGFGADDIKYVRPHHEDKFKPEKPEYNFLCCPATEMVPVALVL